jgi:hypothetical protein
LQYKNKGENCLKQIIKIYRRKTKKVEEKKRVVLKELRDIPKKYIISAFYRMAL